MVSDMGPGPIAVTPGEAEFIKRIHEENRLFYSSDLGQASLRDLQQTFPHHWLYVGELLQNAVDAGAKHIRVAAIPEGFLFEHDGRPFEPEHVRALCARGLSTKGAGTVGFMGIGFKAVYQSFERAAISSGHWRFGFTVKEETGEYGERLRDWLGCVLPEHVDAGEPSPGMQCRFVLTDRLARLGSVHDDVTNVLSSDLVVLALLAQRDVEELSWNGQRWHLAKSTQPVDECTSRLVLSAREEGTGEVRVWVLFSATYQPSRDAIARFLEHRQIRPRPEEREKVYAEAARTRTVDVFCPLDTNGVPVPPKRGHAYALLATGATIPLGLHVQADWLLNTSRRELMDVETNPWHLEILGRLAGLLRSYLSWVTSLQGIADNRLSSAFAVLPSWSEVDGEFGAYIQSDGFVEELRSSLADLAFLPVRTKDGTRFLTPSEARLLPSELRGFDDPLFVPWELFGEHIISTMILGATTVSSLERLRLFEMLRPAELVVTWDTSAVGRWRESLRDGVAEHLRLLRALASLDDEEAWRLSPLRCLPSASGGWIDRAHAMRVPEWGSIPEQDPPLRSWLEPFFAPSESRLDWSFDRAVQRDTGAQAYVAGLNQNKLEDVLGAWWVSLPDKPSDEECTRVLEVTCWVLMTQRQRPGLVTRVLCTDGTLARLSDVVLADPYATTARRRFFPEHRVVSERYVGYKPGYSDADWRSFFESANKTIKGPFRLVQDVRQLPRGAVRDALPGYQPPETKAVPITTRWREYSFYSVNYLLIDATLPGELSRVLGRPLSVEDARGVGLWLTEARQELVGSARVWVAYVPYNSSSVMTDRTAFPAPWVRALQGAAWVVGADGSGPYLPEAVLARGDPARPLAVVAGLPEELVNTLESCGLLFGSAVPQVASVDRLRREGPSAGVERLLELLEAAVSEAAEDGRDELLRVLSSVSLLPVPDGASLIDGAVRVSADRLVGRSARGAELGGWLLSVDAASRGLGADDAYGRLLRLLASVNPVPESPSWNQALGFLRWVWSSRPDAELVRRTLPRAYRLITDEIGGVPERLGSWAAASAGAIVYVASRRWVSVQSEDLYLDDLGEDRLKALVGGLLLATPGHLGETPDEQRRVAGVLGIRLLSTRFRVALEVEDPQALPDEWAVSLQAIVALLQSYAVEENGNGTVLAPPVVAYYRGIRKSLVDRGAETHRWRVFAARDGERVVLSGDPDDFAADLCRVLLQWAGLASRRDLDELAPTITQLIVWMGRPEKFGPRLAAVRSQRGLDPVPAPGAEPPSPTPPSSGPKPTPAPTPPVPGPAGAPSPDPAGTCEPPSEPGPVEPPAPPPASGGYTADDRERRLESVRKRRDELNRQEKELLGVGPVPSQEPDHEPTDGNERPGKFGSDVAYRQAVAEFELANGRYAETKDTDQPGFDIDSYDLPLDDPARRLVRRIEVKGHGCSWEDDETVELSDRQFLDAVKKKADGVTIADDFDYWLYVVERHDDASLHVLPIRNPPRRAAKFEFRAGTWRALAEEAAVQDPEGGDE